MWMRSLWCCTPMFDRHGRCGRDGLPGVDCEYQRRGTANVFCGVQPKAGRHFTKPTANRSSQQFADYLVEIVASYPEAETIHLVMDNLNSHNRKALVDRFGERDRRSVVGAFHGALHSETRQLAESGGDRDQPSGSAMPR